jgi:hypothetical protein
MTTYLKLIPLDLQKEVIKKRYLDVLRELESVTATIRSDFNVYPNVSSHSWNTRLGIRVRVVTDSHMYLTPDENLIEKIRLGHLKLIKVIWYLGYHHSDVSFHTLSKLIIQKESDK